MDRQTVYPGAIPLETDLLNTNKYAMMGLAKLSAAMLGANTYLRGLTCTPSAPPSMTVNIAKGEIYSVQNVDNSAYSSLPADTVNTILKQGVVLNSQAFTLTAPTNAGQSINYLIQATYQDIDSGQTVLPYYNAANPSVAYSGPNNSGVAQNTVRSGVCTVSLKPGVAATTGTQTTPVADTGYTAAWVVTISQGTTSITAANISTALNAPFIPASGLVDAIQKSSMTYSADTGSANSYIASYLPNLPTLIDGMRLTFKAKTANTGASTFAPNGNTAYPLYSHANQALQGGEIIANGLIEVEWNSTLTAWVLCGNSGGALPVAAATQSNHAMQLGQASGRLLNIISIPNSLSYTPTAGARFLRVKAIGGGGASGSEPAVGSGWAMSQAGYYGQFIDVVIPVSAFTAPVSILIGAGGVPAAAGANTGGAGGATSFGSIFSLPGGPGGASMPISTGITAVGASLSTRTIVSSIIPINSSMNLSRSSTVIQVTPGTCLGQMPIPSPIDGGYFGSGGIGLPAASAAVQGNAGSPGIMIIEEFA